MLLITLNDRPTELGSNSGIWPLASQHGLPRPGFVTYCVLEWTCYYDQYGFVIMFAQLFDQVYCR